jgi:hypothetical protein
LAAVSKMRLAPADLKAPLGFHPSAAFAALVAATASAVARGGGRRRERRQALGAAESVLALWRVDLSAALDPASPAGPRSCAICRRGAAADNWRARAKTLRSRPVGGRRRGANAVSVARVPAARRRRRGGGAAPRRAPRRHARRPRCARCSASRTPATLPAGPRASSTPPR